MQTLHQLGLKQRGIQRYLSINPYHHYNIFLPGNHGILGQDNHRNLATKAKNPEDNVTSLPKADTRMESSHNTKGKYDDTVSLGYHEIYLQSLINCSDFLKPSSATAKTEAHDEYHSLKTHREGPNSESGELDSQSESDDVKGHNIAMGNRYDKH